MNHKIYILSNVKLRFWQQVQSNCRSFVNVKISKDKQIEESYKILNIPLNSKQDVVKQAFVNLAKKFHPDSGSPEANIEKFVEIENAFRFLTKHITGSAANEELEKAFADVRHTVPQHRQYLSYEGVGHGTPAQREKQYQKVRAQRAADNVLEHRMAKSLASEKTLMKKGDQYKKKHDIKTKYGFDRLVEDLIQESMSKGEFENLSGKGKPLKDQNTNPYVDFTTHKLNEVLINNGFQPEWIMMSKDIDDEIQSLKNQLKSERMYLGAYPLNDEDARKWQSIRETNAKIAKDINARINTYNIIVPLLNKQKFHVDFNNMCEDVLKNGEHSRTRVKSDLDSKKETEFKSSNDGTVDLFSILFKGIIELLTFSSKEKK